jgi:glycosyltransferase involved in cell wall biosynthesis
MKVCFFTKYPPIEGGVSSRSYWLARALGGKGVEVHIITDALEEELYRENIDFENVDDLTNYQPPNVYVHSLDEIRHSSPFDRRTLITKQSNAWRLASLGIEIIKKYQCDVIDSYYLLPYGVAGYLAKKITGCPLILRHAGSDITAISSYESFYLIFQEIFSRADRISALKEKTHLFFKKIPPEKIFNGFSPWVNSKYFNPKVPDLDLTKYGIKINPNVPVITYIGKIGRNKGIYELVEASAKIKEDFLLLFVSGGPGLEDFKRYIDKFPSLKNKYHFLGFIQPWKIPSVLKRSTCLVQLERDFPIVIHSPIQPIEALAVGTCLIISEEIYEKYKNLEGIEKRKNILVVNPKNIEELKKILKKVVKNINFTEDIGREGAKIFKPEAFSSSVSAAMELYESVAKSGKSLKSCLEELRETISKYL